MFQGNVGCQDGQGVCIPATSFHPNNLELYPVTSVLCIHQPSVLFTIPINSPLGGKSFPGNRDQDLQKVSKFMPKDSLGMRNFCKRAHKLK